MPELPEVESVRRSLEPHLVGRKVRAVEVVRADYVWPAHAPLGRLVGQRFVQTLRHGKKIFCELDDGQTLVVHLGMSGQVLACPPCLTTPPPPFPPHTHLALTLEDGTQIRFRDPRRFGGVWYYPTLREALAREVTGRLGPDALALTPADLAGWRTARGRLKARLLGQRDVAGLGNIYVDEVLWVTRLHPLQQVSRIPAAKVAELVAAIHEVLNRSIRMGGTTLRDYRNAAAEEGAFKALLKAYGRAGQPCVRCGGRLKGVIAAGRTTVFCPVCQKRR